jgi:hypothetical protein
MINSLLVGSSVNHSKVNPLSLALWCPAGAKISSAPSGSKALRASESSCLDSTPMVLRLTMAVRLGRHLGRKNSSVMPSWLQLVMAVEPAFQDALLAMAHSSLTLEKLVERPFDSGEIHLTFWLSTLWGGVREQATRMNQ